MLNYAVENGIIDLSCVQNMIEMKKREEILKNHLYEIYQGKDGKWYTYILDNDNKRVKKKRTSLSKIEDFHVEHYIKKEKERSTGVPV